MISSTARWKDGMAFEVGLEGFSFDIDADPEFGGKGRGPRPKGLLLSSLIGCTGMDVVAILGKMRQRLTSLSVESEGELADEHPKRFTRIVVRYRIDGPGLADKKVRRAVQLSEERYCGVRSTLLPSVRIDSEIWLNGKRLAEPEAAEGDDRTRTGQAASAGLRH